MVSADYLGNPAAAPFFELARARGAGWQFGTNDPAGFLAAQGWRATINDIDEVACALGRWPPPGVPGDVSDRLPELLLLLELREPLALGCVLQRHTCLLADRWCQNGDEFGRCVLFELHWKPPPTRHRRICAARHQRLHALSAAGPAIPAEGPMPLARALWTKPP